MGKVRGGIMVALAACASAPCVHAANGGQLIVSAEVTSGCMVSSQQFGALDFGKAPSTSTETISTALVSTMRVQCTPGVMLSMQVDAGQQGRTLQRTGGGEVIPYRLYGDAGMTTELLPGHSMAVVPDSSGARVLPVHGQVILPGNVPPGTYADVLQVQLSW